MPGLIWSRKARADIDRIEDWLDDNRRPDYSLRVIRAIQAKVALLARSPQIGARLEGELQKTRVLGTPYLIVFADRSEHVEILRLFHESEDWQAKL